MVFWKSLFLTIIYLVCVNSQGNGDIVDIATIETNTTDLHKGMPETLKFNLNTMNGTKPIKLHLTRKKSLHENSFVFVVRQDKNGKPILVKENVPVEKNIGLYQDKNTGGAFTVRCEGLEKGLCNPVLFGSIHINNIEYDLTEIATVDESSPTNPTRQKRRANKRRNKSKGRRVYALRRRKRPRGFAKDYKVFDKPASASNLIIKEKFRPVGKAMALTMSENIIDLSAEKLPVLGRTMVSTSRSRKSVANDDTYNVELLLVIDYSIYLREYEGIQDPDIINKDMEAKSRIRQYFAHVVNGINLRYSNIETNKFHINVAVSGYIIADKPEIAVWTANRVSNNLVDSDDALDLLRSWRLSVSELPEHDHMMLFTAHDLYRYRSSDNKVTGLASFKAMCTSSSVSVIEDNGVFGSISTGTHELAHSLGARHDGSGSNMCSSNEQYIMAVTGGVTNSENELNPWKFSPCSIDELHTFLQNLPPGNCLTDEAVIYDTEEFLKVTSNEVGQVYTPNEQCRQRAGKNSYYGWGGGLGEFKDICTSMACKSETSENSYLIYTAARGTSCGNRQWCVNGLCTTDPNAPRKDESCIHGDSEKMFKGLKCPELIRSDPSRCYENYYREFCCQSCKDIAKPIRGCEYGDKNSFCSTVLDRPHLCYSQNNQDICCDSCQSIYTGYEGCEYGDKVHMNGGRQCSQWRCNGNPDYQKACCKTCGLIPDIPKVRTTRRPIMTTNKPKPKPTTSKPERPIIVKPTRPPTVKPATRPPRPPPVIPAITEAPTISGKLCVVENGKFRSMTCDLVARWMSDICSVSVLKDACCKPCQPKPTVKPECVDLEPCTDVQPPNCYDSFVRDKCCATCKSFETGDKDCVYGDLSKSCERYVRLWPEYVCTRHTKKCCGSCKNAASSRSTFTILSRRMENNIANSLDSTIADSPFRNSAKVPSEVSVISATSNDGPVRGDQIPIHSGTTGNKKGKGKWTDKHKGKGKDKQNKHKNGKEPQSIPVKGDKGSDDAIRRQKGKDSTKTVVWHVRVYRRPRVRRIRLIPASRIRFL